MKKFLLAGAALCLMSGSATAQIEFPPAGNDVVYSRTSSGYVPVPGEKEDGVYNPCTEYGRVSEIRYCDDNVVYMRSPVATYGNSRYIMGVREGDKITFTLPQNIIFFPDYNQDDGEVGFYDAVSRLEDVSTPGYTAFDMVGPETNRIVYTVAEDGTLTLDPGYILGIISTDNEEWQGYCDTAQTWTPFTASAAEPQEGMQVMDWTMEGRTAKVQVGEADGELWIKGLFAGLPEAWVKGTVNGSQVRIHGGQYLGQYKGFFIWLTVGQGSESHMTLLDTPMLFNYDAAAMTLAPAMDAALIAGHSAEVYDPVAVYQNPSFAYVAPEALTPVNPIIYNFDDFASDKTIYFRLPLMSTTGQPLEAKYYKYNMFVDGELYTFEPDTYFDLTRSVTNIPWNRGIDTGLFECGEYHFVSFYMEEMESIGVQGYYTVDGVESRTAVMQYDIATGEVTELSGVAAPASDDVDNTWYDMLGRRVTNPGKGLYIRAGSLHVCK